jgi:hypothetical protein
MAEAGLPMDDMADVYVPVNRVAGLIPTSQSIVDAREPAVTVPVRVFWPQGLRGVMPLTVGQRAARRMRGFGLLMSSAVRATLAATSVTSLFYGFLIVGRLGSATLVWPVLGFSVPVLFLTVLWTVRLPQHPVDMGDGWVVLRRVDPVTAREWQLRNPTAGMVIEPAGRRPRSQPSTGQNWWLTETQVV